MSNLIDLQKLLSALPFSIRGYQSTSERINTFFSKFCESKIIKSNSDVKLVSYSYAQLYDIDKWSAKSFSDKVFFYSKEKHGKLDVEKENLFNLNLYYYVRDKIFPPDPVIGDWRSNNIAIALSRLFRKDISLRITYTEAEEHELQYDDSQKVISVKLPVKKILKGADPICNFKKEYASFLEDSQKACEENDDNLTIQNTESSTFSKINNLFDQSPIREHLNTIVENTFKQTSHLKSLRIVLFEEFKNLDDSHTDLLNNDGHLENNINNLVELFFQVVVISLIYDCWVEYFPATCGVREINGTEDKLNLGGIIVGYTASKELDEDNRAFFEIVSERISSAVSAHTILEIEKEAINHARKAAISQVFARNGSHNIGSHVLAKMITKENSQKNFSWGENEDDKKYKPIKKLTKVDNAYTALANFNSYLRDRMDFLADLSTGTPQMEVSKSLFTDVVAGIDGNRILMNYISGVSIFEYKLQFRDCLDCDHDVECTSPSDCDPITVESGKDIPVSMPNDVMGNQALYIILENIIRNTAKHGGDNNEKIKVFTVEIRKCEADETLYQVWVYDGCGKELGLDNDEEKEFKDVTKQDPDSDTQKIDLIVARQNANINRPILDFKTNELRHGAWGILEMKVAAAYLQKIPIETVDEPQYQGSQSNRNQFYTEYDGKKVPNIIKAVNKNGCLGYVFHIMKPKEVLVVDEVGGLYDNLYNETGKLEQLKNQGVWVMNAKNGNEDFFQNEKVYPHPLMLVIPKNGFEKNKYLMHEGLYRGNLPTRVLIQGKAPEAWETCRWVAWTGEENLAESLSDVSTANQKGGLIHSCWRIWLKNKLNFLDLTGKFDSCREDKFTPDVVHGKSFYKNVLELDEGERPDRNSLKFNFGLDHHGKSIHDVYNKYGEFIFEHYEGYPSAVEPFLKKSRDHVLENSLLVDGILTNILIIDERVQAIYQEKFKPEKGDKFDNNQIRMRGANIHIPDVPVEGENGNEAIDLNQEYYGSEAEEKIKDCIDQVVEQSTLKKGLDFIVIHLGVIEKVLTGANIEKSDKEVKGFIKRIVEKSRARVIITSGRGKPDNLPAEVAFLSYSTLSHYAIETPFKAYLNQVLQSARTF